MDNPKVALRETERMGKSLFARENITKDELIAEFDGAIYEADAASELPNDPPDYVQDHAIQFAHNKWRDASVLARHINHSCRPNVGFKGLFQLVAIRDIVAGEELVLDYDMMENSDWEMRCHLLSRSSRTP